MANQLYLREDFRQALQGQDPFVFVESVQGDIFREFANRKTVRFTLGEKSYFVKIHRGIGLIETLKSLLHSNIPVWGAEREWQAITRLTQLGVATMTPVAFGVKGFLPFYSYSFIVTQDLTNTKSLEELTCMWAAQPPAFTFKKALIEKLANVSRVLHSHGINHRDYYICHFLLDMDYSLPVKTEHDITVSLIDLHRADMRKSTPVRWIIKDLGSLYFSALDIGLTRRDIYRFIRYYTGKSLKEALSQVSFWRRVKMRAFELYHKAFNREPKL